MLRSPLRPLLRPPMQGLVGPGPYTLVQKAIAILRKYGTNAHVYLPGVGTLSGITAGNYLESTGVTAASVDNPVGMGLDALQAMTLGSELNATLDFTGWVTQAGWSVSSGVASYSGAGGTNSLKDFTLKANTHYLIEIDATVASGGYKLMCGFDTVSGTISTSGRYAARLIRGSNTYLYVSSVGASELSFPRISVREIPGIHATQGTTSNKCLLRLTNGKYSWQFDGSNDSLSLSAPLFQMSDDHCVIAGINQTIAANGYVFSQNNTAATTLVGAIAVTSGGFARALWGDDGGTNAFITGSVPITGVTKVVTAIKRTNAKQLRVNGAQDGATNNTAMGATTLNTASIGSYTTAGNFTGLISPVIAIKGTVTDADLLTLERFVGQLSGVSL